MAWDEIGYQAPSANRVQGMTQLTPGMYDAKKAAWGIDTMDAADAYAPAAAGSAVPDYGAVYDDLAVTPDMEVDGGVPGVNKLKVAGSILQGVGGIADIYGMYQQKKIAEKNFKMAEKAYNEQKRRAEMQDKIAREQLAKQNMMTEADYARSLSNEARDVYGSYNRMIGR